MGALRRNPTQERYRSGRKDHFRDCPRNSAEPRGFLPIINGFVEILGRHPGFIPMKTIARDVSKDVHEDSSDLDEDFSR